MLKIIMCFDSITWLASCTRIVIIGLGCKVVAGAEVRCGRTGAVEAQCE